jgi:pimeloyl-ACP methyl ester carboxylesterase
VEDIYLLVSGSGLFTEPPILVGHSLGGAFARRFAYRYPDAVSGLVLLDPTPTFYLPTAMRVIMGTMMQFKSLSSAVGMARRSLYSRNPDATRDEQLLWGYFYASGTHAREVRREYQGAAGSEPISLQKGVLAGLPLTVLLATSVSYPPGFGGLAQGMEEARRRMAEESTLGRLVEADTGHYIHYGDPDLVVKEVLKMIDVVANATSEAAVERP